MKTNGSMGIILLIAILLSMVPIQRTYAQTQSLPGIDKNAVTEFVKNFLSSCNALIISEYTTTADPSTLRHFRLYEATDYSFNVTAMWEGSNSTQYLVFTFVPIVAYSPRIIIDGNTTFACLYFSCLDPIEGLKSSNPYGLASDNSVIVNATSYGVLPFWLAFKSESLFADPAGFSGGAAKWFFQVDQSTIPTVSLTAPIAQSPNSSDLINLLASVIFLVIVIGGGIGAYRNKTWRGKIKKWWQGG